MAVLVLDTSPLSHFARARRLHTLERITASDRRVVTTAVLDELREGADLHGALADLDLGWLEEVRVDQLVSLRVLSVYLDRLGAGTRDIGEAATLTWAEINNAIAVVDEAAGRRVGRERGVQVHGTLWLVARGIQATLLTEMDAEALVDELRAAEAWFPCSGRDFLTWARQEGLL